MKEVNSLNINGVDYICIDEIINNNICYCYFSNKDNEYDVRVFIKDNDNYKGLNNNLEYADAMKLFYDKYNKNTD